ncbi:hypothetical protein Rhopal_002688-T1 [Rhodotorula paludigena]|uniref:P-loop containing nucleoside triphosphate hydrolase protein n=1 Tax=Rhodotorula paludigena TaxID=86838 RepID=A0AAV5GAS6_9BASI|nr:hypothetical protein Rhopal_002688-T1 [Rhodotorula paludigena]
MDPAALADVIRSSTALSLVASTRYFSALPSTLVSGLDGLLHQAGIELHRGDVVEVQGLPGSGKTSLLLHLAATAILPRTAHVRIAGAVLAVPVGGKEQTAVWIDCTARFSIDRLGTIVRHHLDLAIRRYRAPKGIGAPREEELDSLVDECMARLHVFQPSGTLQLAATLQSLPEWALRETADELGYVLIYGMSEFAWADQLARERAGTGATASGPSALPSSQPPLRLVLLALAHLRRTLAPLVFLTQWVFRPHALTARSQEGYPFYAHHFAPPHWPSILATPDPAPLGPRDARNPLDAPPAAAACPVALALHLTLHPPALAPFRRGTSLALVRREQERRAAERRHALKRARGMEGAKEGGVGGTEGIRCVVRRPGGAEVGSWEMEVWEREIVT